MRRLRPWPRLALLIVAVPLVLGACTDEGGASASSTTRVPGRTAPSTTTSFLPPVDGPFAPGRTPLPGFGEVEVRIVPGPDGEPVVVCVLLAETGAQRARGLMEVTDADLGGYAGMLFVFEDDVTSGFWMRDTVLPLSVAYLDADGALVEARDMEPCPGDAATCPTYPPSGPYRSALEVPQGGLEALGVTAPGATLERRGPCRAA